MKEKKSGFTLLEILIILIIVGVLAGIAMPQLFKNVESARSSEAMESIGVIKRSIEACAMSLNNDFSTCTNFANIGMMDPSYNATINAGAHFSYTITTAATTFQIVATRNTVDNGTSGDTVVFARAANGSVTRSGTTAFAGIQ